MLKKQLIPPKMDIIFQALFKKGNEEITKALISSIIGEKIQKIDLDRNKNLLREYANEKMGVLDLIAILDDGVICNVEVQLADNKDIEQRLLFYHSKEYSQQMLIGDKYKELKKTISIAILDYNLEKLKDMEEAHTKWTIMEDKYRKLKLTDELEMHILELPKMRRMRQRGEKSELLDWMLFLDNPNDEEVFEIMKTNKEIEEAMKKLEEIQSDRELMRIIDLKRKAIWDENQAKYAAEVVGMERGIKKGIKQTAINMLKEKIDIELISKVTGLTKTEIEELKKD